MNTILEPTEIDDRRLIELHLAGNATAFRQIVERYQGMVCALAYSACGDVARSEDVAQEVFVAAWQQLQQLREPAKLRAWLGGITRHLVHNSLRREMRAPTARAAELSPDTPADSVDPRDRAIGADEATLMWNALAGLPESYREPLVLFYREGQSIAAVARVLDISEDLARQRLSRGRALLTERMAKHVEEALGRSAPTSAFAGMVLLALPGAMSPIIVETTVGGVGSGAGAKALTAGTVAGAAAQGGVALKLLAAFAALPALLNGLTDYLRFRADLESSSTTGRSEVVATHLRPLLVNAVLLGAFAVTIWLPLSPGWKQLALILPVAVVASAARVGYRRQKLLAAAGATSQIVPAFEYRSRGGWLGLPWLHVRAGAGRRAGNATGWIAVSDSVAIGGLFASAPVAVAPVSAGGVAVGLFALGGVALGIGALGAAAGGAWAVGGLAMASYAARGGFAFARDFAVGGMAAAAHANDAVAVDFIRNHGFFRFAGAMGRVAVWMAFLGWLPPLLLMSWHLGRDRGAAKR